MPPLPGENHDLVSSAAVQVQQALNEAADIGLKAQAAPLDTDRVQGIVRKVTNSAGFDDAAWALDDPVKTFSQAVVDDTLKRNAEFQSKAGLRPRIIRRAEFRCCEWCSQMEGTYTYPDVPEDVYRRHERCRCVVEYDSGGGKRQNVWSKKTGTASGEQYQKGDIAKQRRESELVGRKKFADNISDHPGRITSADPDVLRSKLKSQKIRTFDLKNGGYSADLGNGKMLRYDGKGTYSITEGGKELWTGLSLRDNIESRKTIGLLSSSNRRFDPDIQIPKGVGAKAKDVLVRLPNGGDVRLAPGTRITNVETIAGLGKNRQIDEIDSLMLKYPSTTESAWKKKKGIGYVEYEAENCKAELHWYEEPSVGMVEFKVKPKADGSWFYEDQ